MRISVSILPSFRSNSNIVASASVSIESDACVVHIHDCRLIRSKSGVVWFSLPTFSVQSGRQVEYRPTIELSEGVAQQVSSEALRAYEIWRNERTEAVGR